MTNRTAVDPTMVRTVLNRQTAVEGLGTGGHVVAIHRGDVVLDVVLGTDGVGRRLAGDTLFATYCTLKPLLALVVAQLVDEGELSLHDRLGDLLDGLDHAVGAILIGDLLRHNAGLANPSAVDASFMATHRRDEAVRHAEVVQRRGDGSRAVYSDFAAWTLLGLSVEELAGEPYANVVRSKLIEPLGLTDEIVVGATEERWRLLRDRIGLNIDARSAQRFPLMMERTERVVRDANPAIGGFSTAHGLARLMQATLDARQGTTEVLRVRAETIVDFTSVQRTKTWDPALGRKCGFGFGFQTGLADHGYGDRPSASAYGHTNITAASAMIADPEHDLAISFLVNGIVEDASVVRHRKADIVSAVYEALDLR